MEEDANELKSTDETNRYLALDRRTLLKTAVVSTGVGLVGSNDTISPVGTVEAADTYNTAVLTDKASWEGAYTQGPHAEYVASEDKTFIVYRGDDADPYAVEYDHTTQTFSNQVKVGTNPLSNSDEHGPPTVCVDDNGIIHVFYGCHAPADSPAIEYARSDNAYDISSWTNRSLNSEGTYTSCCVLNNEIYGFFRDGDHQKGKIIRSTDGGDSFTEYTVIDNSTGGNNHDDAYVEAISAYNGRVYFTWLTAYGDNHDDNRQMPRMAYWDPSDQNVYSYDGTNLGSTITWSERHQCNVYDHRNGSDNAEGHIWVARHVFDSTADKAYVSFGYDQDEDGSGFQFKLASYDGISDGSGSWSTQNVGTLSTGTPSNYIAPRINSDGNVECIACVNGDGNGTADGVVATLENGSWTTQTLLNGVCHKNAVVRNGNDDFLGYFSEWDGVEDYDNKLYAVGTEFSGSSVTGQTGKYPIDEGSGSTVYDESGNGRDGSINGASWGTDSNTGGSNDQILSFAGGTDYVETPDDHIRGASQLTQIAWVYLDDKNDDRVIAGDWGQNTKSHLCWYDVGTDSMSAIVRDSSSNDVKVTDTGVSPPVGEWFQVAWTYNKDGSLRLYQNGSETGSTLANGKAIQNGDAGRRFGGDYGSHSNLVGDLHSMFEWNEAKSAAFISDRFDAWDGTTAEYPLDEGSGSTVYDDSGNNRDGSIIGASWGTDTATGGTNDVILSFSGDDTVETPDDHIRGASQFTQIAWVYLDDKNDDRVISGDQGQGDSSFTHVLWYDAGTDSVSAFVRDSAGNKFKVSNTGTSPPTGSWFQVAWTYDASDSLRVFQDGSETGATTLSGNALADGSSNREIGGDYGKHPDFRGDIHSLFEWKEAKAASFIADNYSNW